MQGYLSKVKIDNPCSTPKGNDTEIGYNDHAIEPVNFNLTIYENLPETFLFLQNNKYPLKLFYDPSQHNRFRQSPPMPMTLLKKTLMKLGTAFTNKINSNQLKGIFLNGHVMRQLPRFLAAFLSKP